MWDRTHLGDGTPQIHPRASLVSSMPYLAFAKLLAGLFWLLCHVTSARNQPLARAFKASLSWHKVIYIVEQHRTASPRLGMSVTTRVAWFFVIRCLSPCLIFGYLSLQLSFRFRDIASSRLQGLQLLF
ncbi:hypothetical protein EDD16DRAFT_683916 [Pisolithus croceorrhizus]|nr:hypothetical protein EDD16DRAFT_683916 [Pisolithus croceorrhizus]KAI6125279.1 hypothetical protein EV401DRAFT_1938799 [Pisolithus croceorrhizus]